MIAPGTYNLHIQRGEDFSFIFDLKVDGVILDLTNALIYSQVRESNKRSSTKIIDFTCTVDDVTPPNATPSLNKIKLALTDAQTKALTHDGGFYDVLVVDSNGIDTYYLEGRVTIHNSVTNKDDV